MESKFLNLIEIESWLKNRKVLVVGDIFLDEYTYGVINRVSQG